MIRAGTIRAVCFDVDDTLIDYSASAPYGLAAILGPDADIRVWDALTVALHRMYEVGLVDHTTYQRMRLSAMLTTLGRPVPSAEVLDEMETRRRTAATARLALHDDVTPCLAALRRAGLSLAVLSNADGPSQRRRLEVLGLADAFDTVVLSGETGVAKPDVAAFHHVCDRLGLSPHQVLHVGDCVETDVAGALAAGLTAVHIDRGQSTDRDLPATGLRIHSLLELDDLLAEKGQ